MYPWILCELVADSLGSAEHTLGITAIEESASASIKPLLTKNYVLSSLINYQPLQLGSFSRC
jgi:hypothetical protein